MKLDVLARTSLRLTFGVIKSVWKTSACNKYACFFFRGLRLGCLYFTQYNAGRESLLLEGPVAFTVHFPQGVPGYLLFCVVNGQTEGHGWKICSPQASAVECFVSLLTRLVLAGCSKLGVFGSILCLTLTRTFLPGSWPWGDQPHSPGDMDRVIVLPCFVTVVFGILF